VPHLTAKGHIAFVRMLYANHDDERDSAVSVAATMRAQCYFVNEELDAPTTKALLRRAFVAVGASYHFCVFSISAGAGAFGYYRSPYMVHKMRGLERMWPGMIVGAPLDDNQSFDTVEGFLKESTRLERDSGKTLLPSGCSMAPDSPLQSLVWCLRQGASRAVAGQSNPNGFRSVKRLFAYVHHRLQLQPPARPQRPTFTVSTPHSQVWWPGLYGSTRLYCAGRGRESLARHRTVIQKPGVGGADSSSRPACGAQPSGEGLVRAACGAHLTRRELHRVDYGDNRETLDAS